MVHAICKAALSPSERAWESPCPENVTNRVLPGTNTVFSKVTSPPLASPEGPGSSVVEISKQFVGGVVVGSHHWKSAEIRWTGPSAPAALTDVEIPTTIRAVSTITRAVGKFLFIALLRSVRETGS